MVFSDILNLQFNLEYESFATSILLQELNPYHEQSWIEEKNVCKV